MEEVQQREFKIESYDHLFLEFDLKNHSGKIGEVNVELTPTQAQLFKYAEVKFTYNIQKIFKLFSFHIVNRI